MTLLLRKTSNIYKYLVYDVADPRTKDFFLVENPFYVILTIVLYVYFVTKLGPAMMRNRKPFKLKGAMIVYNIFQIIFNAFIFQTIWRHAYGPSGEYKFLCQPTDHSNSWLGLYAAKITHCYYMLKLTDFMDTIFLVMKKKNNRISFLHVYHHAGIFALSWGAVKYYPGGHGSFVGFLNSFVHMIMYTYYLLSITWLPRDGRQIWWKKYLTLLQIIQFVILGIHQSLPLVLPDCKYTKLGVLLITPQMIFMIALFVDFYIKAYHREKSNKELRNENEIRHKNNKVA